MRILKPLYVSPLVAPFDDGKRIHCVVTALLHVSFAGDLQKDQDLWFYACDETEGMVVDEGLPKPRGEWLVHGSCYARRPDVRQSFVKATVGAQEKVLAVFGPRQWRTAGPSLPEPFEVVPIRFTNAFGGASFPENLVGMGHGGGTPPLVEVRSPFVTTPRDKPPVAGFGRLDPTWPQRMKRMGTYDQKWQKTRYPGMAEDFDPAYFLLSLPDQWREDHFEGTESFSIVNMHPEQEQVGGKLPGITARAFVKKKGEERMVDVKMAIDTVHFYPHRERLVVVCRGTTRTKSDTLADIEEVGFGVEWIDRPKSYAHYMDAFAVKRDRRGGMKRLDDTALIPEGNPPPAPKQRIVAPGEGLRQRQIELRVGHKMAEVRKALVEQGADTSVLDKLPTHIDTSVDPDDAPAFSGPSPTVESVKKIVAERTEAEIQKIGAKLAEIGGDEGESARAALDKTAEAMRRGPVGPPKFSRARTRKELEDAVDQLVAQNVDASPIQGPLEDPKLDTQLRELEAFVRESYRRMVQHQGPAPALDPESSAALRETVREMVKTGQPFAYVDLTGADLSGLDLRGAKLTRAWLESANLTGADLTGAELDFAVVARANLAGADLSKCARLVGTNFSEAVLTGVDFSGLDLTGCFFAGADLSGTRFVAATLDKVDFGKAKMRGTDLSRSTAKALVFHKMRLEQVAIRGARWERPLFHECEVVGLDARGADVKSLAFVDTLVEDSVFDDATLLKLRAARAMGVTTLRRCSFVGTTAHKAFFRSLSMPGSDFRHSDFKESDFSEATLDDSDFQDARLVGARFMSASIRDCKFDRADLMEALLGGAFMDRASFESANLFRADFARSSGDAVNMRGANVKHVRTAPKREESP
jgi:uncharacterized protein YjbI with pentapeptide repeats